MSNLDNKLKYKSSIGFTDLLFNLVIGFVYLFVIAFILINPVAKKGDVIKKAEYMVVIEWNHEYNDDIDLWVKDPAGNVVSFLRKSHGLMHLEKDDLGYSNDVYVKRNKEQIIHLNREVLTLRGTVQGEYEVMAHVYSRKFTIKDGKPRQDLPGIIEITVIKINPYSETYFARVPYIETAQTLSLVRFNIGEDHAYLGHNNNPSDFITKKGVRGTGRYNPYGN
tara:strand:+ start:647 stop:1315 length:669 start_codon:yes stop_codon:yes gene_type:complete